MDQLDRTKTPAYLRDVIEPDKPNLKFPVDDREYPAWVSFTTLRPNKKVEEQQKETLRRQQNGLVQISQENTTVAGSTEGIPEKSCMLYLPAALSFGDRADYNENQSISGPFGAGLLLENAIQGGSNLQSIRAAGKGLIDGYLENAAGTGKIMAVRAASFLGDEIGGAVKSATRVSINPNFRSLFNSVPIRSFTFEFDLVPRTLDETHEIKRIIYFFRRELYPSKIAPVGANSSFGYKFPNTFKIMTYYNNESNNLTHGYLPCFLTSVDVTYNGENMSFFEAPNQSANFTSYKLSLRFTEIRALSRKDIEEGL